MIVGTEWLIEATDCDAEKLRDEFELRAIFEAVVTELGLKVVESLWHKFPGEGGVTGMALLTESHLTCHTYPEHRTATFNLYCCRTRPEWDWDENLRLRLGANQVTVRSSPRGSSTGKDLKLEVSDLKSLSAGGEV
jgi:S-adenosylmethionine decarboxylase